MSTVYVTDLHLNSLRYVLLLVPLWKMYLWNFTCSSTERKPTMFRVDSGAETSTQVRKLRIHQISRKMRIHQTTEAGSNACWCDVLSHRCRCQTRWWCLGVIRHVFDHWRRRCKVTSGVGATCLVTGAVAAQEEEGAGATYSVTGAGATYSV